MWTTYPVTSIVLAPEDTEMKNTVLVLREHRGSMDCMWISICLGKIFISNCSSGVFCNKANKICFECITSMISKHSLMLFPAWNLFSILLLCQDPPVVLVPPQNLLPCCHLGKAISISIHWNCFWSAHPFAPILLGLACELPYVWLNCFTRFHFGEQKSHLTLHLYASQHKVLVTYCGGFKLSQ